MPHYWLVDPGARTIESYVPAAGAYGLATRAAGEESFSAPPFTDLTIDAAALWR